MSFGACIGFLPNIISVCEKDRWQPRPVSTPWASAANQCGIGFSDLAVAPAVVDQLMSMSRRVCTLFPTIGPIASGNRPYNGCQTDRFAMHGVSSSPRTSRDPVKGFLCQSVGNASRLSKSAVRLTFVR